jgi:hypothetical protein
MNESKEKETYKHPSFGQIKFSRCNGGNQGFYGSELPQDHYITMEVKNSEIQRDLRRDWHFAYSLPLIEIRMTASQFSEMLTSLNHGSGVPCTIEMVNMKPIEKYPQPESRKEFVHRKFKDRMTEFAKTLKIKQNRVKELTAKKTLSKADQEELNRTVEWLTTEVASNIPFFAECFQETMDEIVVDAKAEVENAIQHKITTLGLTELHKQNGLLGDKKQD